MPDLDEEELRATRKLNGIEWKKDNQIQIGEYVRTKKHGIFRILSKRKTPYGYYCGATDSNKQPTYTVGKGGSAEIKNDILKHSQNIIDIIECGDYINGKIVKAINEWKSSKEGCFRYLVTEYHEIVRGDEIETIVTHEQFNSVMYKVKE